MTNPANSPYVMVRNAALNAVDRCPLHLLEMLRWEIELRIKERAKERAKENSDASEKECEQAGLQVQPESGIGGEKAS